MRSRTVLNSILILGMLLCAQTAGAAPTGFSMEVDLPSTSSAAPVNPAAMSAIIDMEVSNEDVLNVYRMLGQMAGLNLMADPNDITGRITLKLTDLTLQEALDQVGWYTGYQYLLDGKTLIVASADRMKTLRRPEMDFLSVINITPDTAKSLIETAVPGITVQVDTKAEHLLVSGTGEQLNKAKAILKQYDIPKPQTFDFQNEPVTSALRTLAKSAGVNIMVLGNVGGTISVVLSNMAPREAFDYVVKQLGLVAEASPEGIIAVKPAPQPETISGASDTMDHAIATAVPKEETRLLQVKYIPLQTAEELLKAAFPNIALKTAPNAMFIAATGYPADLNAAEELLAWQDFPVVRLGGIVQQGDAKLAFLEVAGKSYIVKEGDRIGELSIESITGLGVEIRLNSRHEYLSVGGSK